MDWNKRSIVCSYSGELAELVAAGVTGTLDDLEAVE